MPSWRWTWCCAASSRYCRNARVGEYRRADIGPRDVLRRQIGIKPGKLIGIRQRIGDIAEGLFVRRTKHDVALPSR